MSDIFREVDEEVRRERLQQLWDRHGNLIVALALLIVIAVGGVRQDVIAVVGGTALYLVLGFWFHPYVVGVPAFSR